MEAHAKAGWLGFHTVLTSLHFYWHDLITIRGAVLHQLRVSPIPDDISEQTVDKQPCAEPSLSFCRNRTPFHRSAIGISYSQTRFYWILHKKHSCLLWVQWGSSISWLKMLGGAEPSMPEDSKGQRIWLQLTGLLPIPQGWWISTQDTAWALDFPPLFKMPAGSGFCAEAPHEAANWKTSPGCTSCSSSLNPWLLTFGNSRAGTICLLPQEHCRGCGEVVFFWEHPSAMQDGWEREGRELDTVGRRRGERKWGGTGFYKWDKSSWLTWAEQFRNPR